MLREAQPACQRLQLIAWQAASAALTMLKTSWLLVAMPVRWAAHRPCVTE